MPIIKMMAGNYWKFVTIESYTDNTYKLTFNYDRNLIEEIKNMETARWNPEGKFWTIKNSERNKFALEYLCGKNPHAKWLKELEHYEPNRKELKEHQKHILDVVLNRRQVLIAGEMGIGKSLCIIEAMELSGCDSLLWVAPNSALNAVKLEMYKWKSNIYPQFSTYDSLKKIVREWPSGVKPFKFICFDECHKLMNMQTQRYEAAKYLINSMYEEYDDPYIVMMSGTPSPRDPSCFYGPIELLRPGWIREGDIRKFKRRLALIKDKESLAGGWYPELVTWWDNENKCKHCGKFEEDIIHTIDNDHTYEKSINEVEKLYKRLKGIVDITFKKDVLKDLPEKTYRIIKCETTQETLRAAKLIVANQKNVISGLTLLRELSDGFQYQEIPAGTKICELCKGRKKIIHNVGISFDECPSCGGELQKNESGAICIQCSMEIEVSSNEEEIDCPHCAGSGETPKFIKEARQVPSEKESIVKDLLEEYEEVGRVVIYAGFQGSVDRCLQICKNMEWEYIRVDGRGWMCSFDCNSQLEMLKLFQDKNRKIPKLAFIAQPDAGGIGLTLTESPVEIYYSNSFIPASRQQSEDRIHRPGADINRGCTIIDIINLPSDQRILDNLKRSQQLQSMSLGDFQKILD